MQFLFYLLFLFPLFAKQLDIEVNACAAILMNAETGAVLYEKNPHVPAYPASVTKVATALFVLDEKKPHLEGFATISAEDLRKKSPKNWEASPAHWLEHDGSVMGLRAGEKISFEALLHGLMLASGNDAANVLASSLSGSIPKFVEEMNGYVQGLGCLNTRFCNPHGLHHPDHVTTAYDLCLMTKKALQLPKFREIVSKLSYKKARTNKQGPSEIKQHNALLKPGRHYYSKALGVKTGYTSHAQNTLVAAAEHEGRVLIAVLLGCSDRSSRYEDAIRLFERAFAEEAKRRLFFGPHHLFSYKVGGAKTPLFAQIRSNLEITYFPAEEPSVKAYVQWQIPQLPIRKGDKVGEVQLCNEKGELLQKEELFAKEAVKRSFFASLKELVDRLF